MKHKILQSSLIKSMQILELLVEAGEAGISDLGRVKKLNRSNVHRILSTFEFLGYVDKDETNRKYKPSLRLFELGSLVIQRNGIIKVVRPFLEKLGSITRETNNLAVLDKNEVVYIDKVESSEVLRMDLAVGRHVPAYCTALGKILLAGLSEDRLTQYFKSITFVKRSRKTLSKEQLKKQLVEIRKKSFAIDDEELYEGIRCIAVPIRNAGRNIIAAISTAGPSVRMDYSKLEDIKPIIIDMALEISKQLGFNPDR